MQACLKNLSVEGGCEGAHARPALFQSIQRAELMKNVPWAISTPLEHWAILRALEYARRARCAKSGDSPFRQLHANRQVRRSFKASETVLRGVAASQVAAHSEECPRVHHVKDPRHRRLDRKVYKHCFVLRTTTLRMSISHYPFSKGPPSSVQNWQEPLVRGFHPLRPRVCTQALRPREACRKCLRSTTLHLQKAVAVQAGLTPALPTSLSKRRPLRGCAQGSFQGRFAVLLHGGRLPG